MSLILFSPFLFMFFGIFTGLVLSRLALPLPLLFLFFFLAIISCIFIKHMLTLDLSVQRYCLQNYRASFESKKTLKGVLKKYKKRPRKSGALKFWLRSYVLRLQYPLVT